MRVDATAGLAFDTNLLGRPTQRRLMSLWMEQTGLKVLLLPGVFDELCAPNLLSSNSRIQRMNARRREGWERVVAMPGSPYAKVVLTDEQQDAAADILQRFTLRCFPGLNEIDDIGRNADAAILAQGLALGVDLIVTNNMKSIDHFEVNDLARRAMGRNSGVLITADDAITRAHAGGEASARLLEIAMASCWPEGGDELLLDAAHERLLGLCEILEAGLRMPNTAQRLLSIFDTSEDLDRLLEAARRLSIESPALKCERWRRQWLVDEEAPVPRGGTTDR